MVERYSNPGKPALSRISHMIIVLGEIQMYLRPYNQLQAQNMSIKNY